MIDWLAGWLAVLLVLLFYFGPVEGVMNVFMHV